MKFILKVLFIGVMSFVGTGQAARSTCPSYQPVLFAEAQKNRYSDQMQEIAKATDSFIGEFVNCINLVAQEKNDLCFNSCKLLVEMAVYLELIINNRFEDTRSKFFFAVCLNCIMMLIPVFLWTPVGKRLHEPCYMSLWQGFHYTVCYQLYYAGAYVPPTLPFSKKTFADGIMPFLSGDAALLRPDEYKALDKEEKHSICSPDEYFAHWYGNDDITEQDLDGVIAAEDDSALLFDEEEK